MAVEADASARRRAWGIIKGSGYAFLSWICSQVSPCNAFYGMDGNQRRASSLENGVNEGGGIGHVYVH